MLLLLFFFFFFFDRAKETNMYETSSRRLRSQILACFLFLALVSKKITVSLKKSHLSEKNVLVKEELGCIEIDDIENLEDSPRL